MAISAFYVHFRFFEEGVHNRQVLVICKLYQFFSPFVLITKSIVTNDACLLVIFSLIHFCAKVTYEIFVVTFIVVRYISYVAVEYFYFFVGMRASWGIYLYYF